MLGEAMSAAPDSFRFAALPSGKPILVDGFEGLHFSLAHSRRWVVCAVGRMPIGVDIERADKPISSLVLDRFAPEEINMIQALPAGEAQYAFYRTWTLKEAVLKATGEGLRRSLASFAISLDPLAVTMADATPCRLHLAEFSAVPSHPVALAALCASETPVTVWASQWG